MVDKIFRLMKTYSGAEKIIVFFVVFAAVILAVSGIVGENTEQSLSASSHIDQEPKAEMVFALQHSSESTDILANKKKVEIREIPAVPDENGNGKNGGQKEKANSTNLASKVGGFVYSESIPMSRELQEYTYEKCVEQGLEYELVLAVIWRESRFKTDAVHININGTKDNGIMQINDVNSGWLYQKYGINDLMDPYQNINAGTAMLGEFTRKYGAHGAMMAYQYGESGMARRLQQGYTTSRLVELAYSQRDYYRQII